MRRKISRRSVLGKRVPQRTCVACRVVKDKRELVRLVRVPDGDVEVDDEGKIADGALIYAGWRSAGVLD